MNYHFVRAFKDNYIWVISNERQKAIVVDPGCFASTQLFLNENQLELAGIWVTHHHNDHIGGIAKLQQEYGFNLPVWGPTLEAQEVITHPLKENDLVNLSGFPSFKIVDIPGHTLGHIAYYGDNRLFCGDTLFGAGCGRLFEGTPEQMYSSLLKISRLPDDTLIYCAHEYTANNLRFALMLEPHNQDIAQRLEKVKALLVKDIPSVPFLLAEEKLTNPFLRCEHPAVIHFAEDITKEEIQDPVKIFKYIRILKDHF